MFDWLKRLVTERLIGRVIGYSVSHLATVGLEAHGVNIDTVKLQASLWAGYEAMAHKIEAWSADKPKWVWLGKVL